jgi:Copper transport outer membrane protein, MctB
VINLRYHIVSITAVFLALGIGLTLGSTFLDRVTVDNLKNQLDTVQRRVDQTETANEALTDRVDALDQRDDALAEALPERLLGGHLDAVPVLVVAASGTDEALVQAAVGSLSSAGAQVAGTWWLTDRWALDDPDEVGELATLLEVSTQDADRLRRNGAIRMAEVLDDAAQPAPEPPAPDPAADPSAIPELPAAAPTPEPVEPPLVARLEDAGFIDYEALPGAAEGPVLLPGADARYVIVSSTQPDAGAQLFATALLDEVVADGVAPVVAAQGEVDLTTPDGPAPEDTRRTSFVGPLREGETTRDRLTTVDNLDTAAGLAALVLAVEDLADLRTGHYGVAPGAARLLPGADPET